MLLGQPPRKRKAHQVMRSRGDVADSVTLGSHQSKPRVSPPQDHHRTYKLTRAFDSPPPMWIGRVLRPPGAPTLGCPRPGLTWPRPPPETPTTPWTWVPGLTDPVDSSTRGPAETEANRKPENHLLTEEAQAQEAGLG